MCASSDLNAAAVAILQRTHTLVSVPVQRAAIALAMNPGASPVQIAREARRWLGVAVLQVYEPQVRRRLAMRPGGCRTQWVDDAVANARAVLATRQATTCGRVVRTQGDRAGRAFVTVVAQRALRDEGRRAHHRYRAPLREGLHAGGRSPDLTVQLRDVEPVLRRVARQHGHGHDEALYLALVDVLVLGHTGKDAAARRKVRREYVSAAVQWLKRQPRS